MRTRSELTGKAASTSRRTSGRARQRKASGTDWREGTLALLRRTIVAADPAAVEEMKWKKPSNPEGVPVWSRDGILCVANVLKGSVRLTFPYGPEIPDPKQLFNSRLDSKVVRAIDVFEGEKVDRAALIAIVRAAVRRNVVKASRR